MPNGRHADEKQNQRDLWVSMSEVDVVSGRLHYSRTEAATTEVAPLARRKFFILAESKARSVKPLAHVDARLRAILRNGTLRLIFEAGGSSAAIDLCWPLSEARRLLFLTGSEDRVRVVVPGRALFDAA